MTYRVETPSGAEIELSEETLLAIYGTREAARAALLGVEDGE